MALVVEDGTGLANADCYCSVDYLDAYLTKRGLEHGHSTQDKESALVIAAQDWLDGQHQFTSEETTDTQSLAFPRVDFGVPEAIKKANALAAHLHLHGLLLVDTSKINQLGVVKAESKNLDTLSKSVEYFEGSAQLYERVLPANLKALIRPYLENSGGLGRTYRVL
jgi:hypothetical protein